MFGRRSRHLAWAALGGLALGCASSRGLPVVSPRSELPLVEAAIRGDQPAFDATLKGGAKVNAKDRRGRTALMEAASYNRVDMVRRLLGKGAKPDLRDNGGSTALLIASASGNDAAIESLLRGGADPNGRGWRGRTPLMAAVGNHLNQGFEGRTNVVYPVELIDTARLLLSCGADAGARDEEGRTALAIAEERGLAKTAAALRKALSKTKPKARREP